MIDGDMLEIKLKKKQILEEKLRIQSELPHLYGWKFYEWARKVFDSKNKMVLLCAANQISKSSTIIRKAIHWATEKSKWSELWMRRPLQFWYLYPSKDVATIEFNKKWVPEFMPRGSMLVDEKYGWKAEYNNKRVAHIDFKSGVTIFFKSYEQNISNLQTGTVDAIFCDEELPEALFDELMLRRAATNGYFHMVFTATLGQEMWRQAMEERGELEKFTRALKVQVSMFDCLEYEDGSKSKWTEPRIKDIIRNCRSQQEVQRRVYGKFVVSEGLKYPGFSAGRNIKRSHPIPRSWLKFAGIDIGSSGERGHKSAICFVAVKPDYTAGRVFLGYREDYKTWTAYDVLQKYNELRLDFPVIMACYDTACKDFGTIAGASGVPVIPAEKSHEIGENILNALFRNGMLAIYDTSELRKLITELGSLRKETSKTVAKDDFCDALRYAVTRIPWDWSALKDRDDIKKLGHEEEIVEGSGAWRRMQMEDEESRMRESIENMCPIVCEIEEANEFYDI